MPSNWMGRFLILLQNKCRRQLMLSSDNEERRGEGEAGHSNGALAHSLSAVVPLTHCKCSLIAAAVAMLHFA